MMRILGADSAIAVSTRENPVPTVAAVISADIRAIDAWSKLDRELALIRNYGPNWDGRGSDPPSDAAIGAAVLFLNICREFTYMRTPARIALSPSGFVSVDWISGDTLVSAEIQDGNEIEWMRAKSGQATEFFTTKLLDDTGSEIQQVQTWQPAPVGEEELVSASVL